MRFIIASFLFLTCTLNVYAGAGEMTVATESRLYEQATAKLVAIPKDYNETITDILKNGWREDANIIKVINDNLASLELFRKATLETSDGYIFGKADKFDVSSKLPNYRNYMQLFKLLMLEGRFNEAKGLQKEAQEDYLAATRFMIHVSQQKYGIMISTMVNSVSLDLANVCLEGSFPNDALYRDNLLNNLKKLKSNQDFLEGAFKEEAEGLKNTARTFEEAAKKGATFEELFQISTTADSPDKEQINQYRAKSKELTAMLDGEFFAEFYNQVDPRIDEFTEAAIRGAKENNSEIYENKIKDFHDSNNKLGKPLSYLLWSLGKTTIEGKSVKLVVADTMANVYLTIATPNFSKTIGKYWEFYNRLDVLISKFTEKNASAK